MVSVRQASVVRVTLRTMTGLVTVERLRDKHARTPKLLEGWYQGVVGVLCSCGSRVPGDT